MDKKKINNGVVFFEWEAPIRFFEKKSSSYFKTIISIAVIISLLLYFLAEYILLFVVWVIVFLLYIKVVVPPPLVRYQLTKFGIQFYNHSLRYDDIQAFSIIKKPQTTIIRFFTAGLHYFEYRLILPNGEERAEIIHFLQEKIPYIESVPRSEVEKIADFLKSLIGLNE